MKVLHVITGLNTGGAERALYNLLQGGLSERFDNYVVCLLDQGTIGPELRKLDVPVQALGMRAGVPTIGDLLKLRRICKNVHPDIVQGWMYHGNLAATSVRLFAHTKPALVWNIRQTLYDLQREKRATQWVIKANRLSSKRPATILYNSRLSRRQHENLGFCSAVSQVIPNGIAVDQFRPSAALRQSARAELEIPQESLLVGHIARLHPMKDHSLFVDAAVSIARSHPDVRFLMCGLGVTSSNSHLTAAIPDSMRDRFYLLGERSDVPMLMGALDLFCLSSAWGEGFPNVLGEAMASGLPCVTTDVGDSGAIIGDTGVVVPTADRTAMIAGLTYILSRSGDERLELGADARRRIQNNYTLSAIVGQYAALYERLAGNSEAT